MSKIKAHTLSQIHDIDEAVWNSLCPDDHPFLAWAFLKALEDSRCASEETGWIPRHLWLVDDQDKPVGAAPLYVKTHSQGEYVFDHGWANALHRAGGQYYPKLQCAVPFTPVCGPRLLASTPDIKSMLIAAMTQICEDWGCSSVHATFIQDADHDAFQTAGYLIRHDRQFHFINRDFQTFEDFLSSLSSRKRKTIRKERHQAQEGLSIKRLRGDDIKSEHWDFFFRCYMDTGARKWGSPYLNRDFFAQIHDTLRDKIILLIAFDDETPIATALNFLGTDTLYGRYWGCLASKPFLHFELCYYQAIEIGLELGLSRIEAGAQGEHKLARGYEPIITRSAHYLRHSGLQAAVADYLTDERRAVSHEINILSHHTPFKKV